MANPTPARFGWFQQWVDQRVGVALGVRRSLEDGRADTWTVGELSLDDDLVDEVTRLSAGRHAAIALVFTPTISTMTYAEDGALVSGVDLTVPTIRFGAEPDRFDDEIDAALSGAEAGVGPAGRAAHLVELAFGLTIEPAHLDA